MYDSIIIIYIIEIQVKALGNPKNRTKEKIDSNTIIGIISIVIGILSLLIPILI